VARSSIARRPAGDRTGTLDRPFRKHVPIDIESTAATGSGLGAAGPMVSTHAVHPVLEEAITEVTPASFWALLPEAERERLGLRFSRLVLKALRTDDPREVANG
jgi:hypothetical protein